MRICADFETTVVPDYYTDEEIKEFNTCVWIACFVEDYLYNDIDNFDISFSIEEFFNNLLLYIVNNRHKDDTDITIFFHNLKFDGSFILNFFEEHKIKYETFINDMNVFYSITVYFEEFTLIFRDSLKVINFALKNFSKVFGYMEKKGDTPLLTYKPMKEEIKDEWIHYVKIDVGLLAKGIYTMFHQMGFTKYTCAGESLKRLKETINFKEFFPELDFDTDEYCRKAYKGGFTYVKDSIKGKIIEGDIEVYDKNSMYPAIMLNYPLPFGTPTFHKGSPEYEKEGTFYIARIMLNATLKKGYLPTFQTKDDLTALSLGISKNDYIKDTKDTFYEFYFTNYDLELIKKHYNCEIEYLDYYKFDTHKGFYDDYFEPLRKQKEAGGLDPAMKHEIKILLNSPYGKTGSRIITRSKKVFLENGILKFGFNDYELVHPIYIPTALAVTSIGRYEVITAAQSNYDMFLYADTDSNHYLVPEGVKIDLPIHNTKFGYWKLEDIFNKGKYLRAKLYMESNDEKTEIKGAGMTPEIKSQINYDNFEVGKVFYGKKSTRQVKGGMIIVKTTFKISEKSIFN